jgi:hypothetical protein
VLTERIGKLKKKTKRTTVGRRGKKEKMKNIKYGEKKEEGKKMTRSSA